MGCSCNNNCDPCPPCETQLPVTCEALDTTTEAINFVVEDSAFCKKTIVGTNGQVPQILGGFIEFTDATSNATADTIVSRDSLGGADFARIDATELHVNNPVGDTRIELGGSGNVYMDLKNPNSDDYDLRIQASGTDPRILTNAAKLLVDGTVVALQSVTNGDVGIGTASPSYKLDITETQTGQTAVRAYNPDTAGASSAGLVAQQGAVTGNFLANGNAEINLGSTTNHPVILKANNTNYVYLTGAGNLGVGVTSPSQKFEVSGGIRSITSAGGVGYGTGAGGAVTQLTSKSTAVTLNNICGAITMNGAALNANTSVQFVLTNSTIGIFDTVVLGISGGTAGAYTVVPSTITAGSITIRVTNTTGGNLSETPVVNFAVIKAVNA